MLAQPPECWPCACQPARAHGATAEDGEGWWKQRRSTAPATSACASPRQGLKPGAPAEYRRRLCFGKVVALRRPLSGLVAGRAIARVATLLPNPSLERRPREAGRRSSNVRHHRDARLTTTDDEPRLRNSLQALNTALTTIGLSLDIVGVLLLWRFGLPPDVRRGGKSFLLLEQSDEAEAKRAQLYDRFSHLAILLLVAGFALQLLGTLLPVAPSEAAKPAATQANAQASAVPGQASVPARK